MALKFNFYNAPDVLLGGTMLSVSYSDDKGPVGFAPSIKDIKGYVVSVLSSPDYNHETNVSLISNPSVNGSTRVPASRLEEIALELKEQVPNVEFILN